MFFLNVRKHGDLDICEQPPKNLTEKPQHKVIKFQYQKVDAKE